MKLHDLLERDFWREESDKVLEILVPNVIRRLQHVFGIFDTTRKFVCAIVKQLQCNSRQVWAPFKLVKLNGNEYV